MALLLLLCWISSVYGPHWGHAFVCHQPVDTLQDMLFGKCHRLREDLTSCNAEATLPPRFSRDIPDETDRASPLPADNHLLGCDDNDCHFFTFSSRIKAPEQAASILCHSGVGLGFYLRKDHVPRKDASVKPKDVNCVDKKTWYGTPISSRRWISRT